MAAMFSFLKTKKSAGIRITPAVHRLIALANAARDRGNWDEAADLFQQALTLDPTLVHIWIQLGHAEKERRRYGEAEAAYVRAALLAPDQAEAVLHLGHMQKRLGNVPAAARAFLRAARLNPTGPRVLEELQQFIAGTTPFARADLIALLRTEIFGESQKDQARSPSAGSVLLDVSGLIAAALADRNFDSAGLVAHRLAPALVRDGAATMCAHVVGHGRWMAVSDDQFSRILALGKGADAMGAMERQSAVTDLDLSFLLSGALEMPAGALLVDLDAAHAPTDHALFVRAARNGGARYVAFGADLPAGLGREATLVVEPNGVDLTADAVRERIAAAIAAGPAAAAPSIEAAHAGRIEQLSHGAFRTGMGWLPPEDWGCWATMPGGELEIAVPDIAEPRLYLRLRALPGEGARYRITLPDGRRSMGEIGAGEHKWIVIDDLPLTNGLLRLVISGENSKRVRVQGSNRTLPAMIGVAGFYLCERNDRAARTALLEAAMFGDLETLR